MREKLLGYYNYTVVLTYCGALSAVAGIFCAMNGNYLYSVLCLMGAGICDMFDGAVAATKERCDAEKCFGIQIDSLSDLVSFGVMPGLFVYCFFEKSVASAVAAAFYILCALIRLAYFNVLEEERQRTTQGPRTSYLGVPVTTVAALLPAVYMVYDWGFVKSKGIFMFLILLLGVGFISPLHIKKPQIIGKIILVVLGAAEMIGLLLLMGVEPL